MLFKMEAINKLQELEPEKLTELCRMHLTFILDLQNDEFSALIDGKDHQKKKNRYYFSRKDKSSDAIPLNQGTISHIYQIIEFLGRDGNVFKEGLFRKTGSLIRQQELKTLLRMGENIDFNSGTFNVHDCASVLKNFLAELPEPLLSEAHYFAHCKITDMCQDTMTSSQKKHAFDRQLKATKLLLMLLPPDNYCLLKYLLLLLNQIQNAQEKNRMTSANLATLFAPHIICPRKMTAESLKNNFPRLVKCIAFLIDNATVLFEPPKELVQDVLIYLKRFDSKGVATPVNKENDAVKTVITFCDRSKMNVCTPDNYTNMALSELKSYIETLPDSTRKRKLIKKLQKENGELVNEPKRKHFRSRSVGEAIKKRFMKNAHKQKDVLEFRHSAFNMGASISKSTDSISSVETKSASVEALCLEEKETKLLDIRKNLLRASRKKIQKIVVKTDSVRVD